MGNAATRKLKRIINVIMIDYGCVRGANGDGHCKDRGDS